MQSLTQYRRRPWKTVFNDRGSSTLGSSGAADIDGAVRLLPRGGDQESHRYYNNDVDVVDDDDALVPAIGLMFSDKEGRRMTDGGGGDASALPVTINDAGGIPMMTMTTTTAPSLPLLLMAMGRMYVTQLSLRPILTKSLTAGIIFGLSDMCAQSIEHRRQSYHSLLDDRGVDRSTTTTPLSKSSTVLSYSRILTSFLVGVLYFGPAAHYWYNWILRIMPSTSLLSTLQKALLGQLIFGPIFTSIFFGAGMLRTGEFTVTSWLMKVRNDLPSVWVSGCGYWPLVDFLSFMIVPAMWIPLFVNFASFIWTIYLSAMANQSS